MIEPDTMIRTKPIAMRVQVGATSIELLAEIDDASRSQETEIEHIMKHPVLPQKDAVRNCQALGPFTDVLTGRDVADQLSAIGYKVELKAIDSRNGKNDFRVMMPPASSLQAAFRKLSELKAQNIDSYVITSGKDALSISLGVFSKEKTALTVRQSLKDAGYETKIVTISRVSREFWVFLSDAGRITLDPLIWQQMKENYPEIMRRARQCQET